MTLDGMAERSADVDGQDATAVPGGGVRVVERVGGFERGLGGAVDVALRRACLRGGRADRLAGDAAERDARAVGLATVTIDALFCLRRIALRVEPALGDLEGDARDEVAGASRSRASSASRQTARSPCGCGANRLPPTVAMLRIVGEAIEAIDSRRNGTSRASAVSVVVAPTVHAITVDGRRRRGRRGAG